MTEIYLHILRAHVLLRGSLSNAFTRIWRAQLEQADLPAAVGALRRLVARTPHSPQAHHALAAALHRQALELSALGESHI